MFKRYDLDVYFSDICIYSSSFSSINHMVKFACGFDRNNCELDAIDTVMERSIPINELCKEFEGDCYGI